MLNFNWTALTQEAAQHWQHALAAGAAIRQAMPMQEWIKAAVIAVVTAVITSSVTIARLEERIDGIQAARAQMIKQRDEQTQEIKRDIRRIEQAITDLQIQLAGRRAR